MLRHPFHTAFWLALILLLLVRSDISPDDPYARVRPFTRNIEFEYTSWMLNAFWLKLEQTALGTEHYLPPQTGRQTVLDYITLIGEIQQHEGRLRELLADPAAGAESQTLADEERQTLETLRARRAVLEPLAEAVLQSQISVVLAEQGLTLGGQPLPPVLYHVTPPPSALIVSPRQRIEVIAHISISPDLSIDEQTALENRVDSSLDTASLIVGIGGVGVYPTMVMQTTDINWLTEVVAHEWIHNYLTLRPLGLSYMNSDALRTMNETTASIAGIELGRLVVARFYPEYLPPPPIELPQPSIPATPSTPPPAPVFDFNAQMHETRVTVDALLAAGDVTRAEEYMEQRRVFLWENGYHIRKINQAYFAFYGAYASSPGGAAGEDPVGAAVRALRLQSLTLAAFINQISWITSFEELQSAVR